MSHMYITVGTQNLTFDTGIKQSSSWRVTIRYGDTIWFSRAEGICIVQISVITFDIWYEYKTQSLN
jgi:hypothetical protein